MSIPVYKNLIAGEWVASHSGKTFLNINPARNTDVVGEFPSSNARDVDDAVAAARSKEVARHYPLMLLGLPLVADHAVPTYDPVVA